MCSHWQTIFFVGASSESRKKVFILNFIINVLHTRAIFLFLFHNPTTLKRDNSSFLRACYVLNKQKFTFFTYIAGALDKVILIFKTI